jgi:peptidoglycan/xylan/chitin deacetylase (PgdA/CDA1 family)
LLIGAAALLANLAVPAGTVPSVDTRPVASFSGFSAENRSLAVTQPRPLPSPAARAPVMQEVQVVPPGRPTLRVPIFMYHYIRVNPNTRDSLGFNLSVTPDDFRRQMDLLSERHYNPIDFDDLRAYWNSQQPLPGRPVILTFDDGYIDFYTTAYPILRQHGFKAVTYVVPGFLNGPNYMSTAQVQDLDAHGIQVGSHTVSHADLTKVSTAQLHHQLVESKRALEQMVGHPVLDFCYPAGMYNANAAAAVQAAGYQTATTTQPGLTHSMGDRFAWTRQRVGGGQALERFLTDLGAEEPTTTITRQAPLQARQPVYLLTPPIPPIRLMPDPFVP